MPPVLTVASDTEGKMEVSLPESAAEPAAETNDAPAPSAGCLGWLCPAFFAPRSKKRIVFVLGGPGSGKGTQCAKLVEAFKYKHLSAGDLLRAEVASGSATADLINGYITEGQIVPSEITVALLKKAIDGCSEAVVLVDGFPRALDQIDEFHAIVGYDCDFVLFFDCNEELLTKRLLKRGETSGRADDNLESIAKRFLTFRNQSYPVVEKYEVLGKVKRVDSSVGTPDEVFAKVAPLFSVTTGK
jgi:UMP-CMP kinase